LIILSQSQDGIWNFEGIGSEFGKEEKEYINGHIVGKRKIEDIEHPMGIEFIKLSKGEDETPVKFKGIASKKAMVGEWVYPCYTEVESNGLFIMRFKNIEDARKMLTTMCKIGHWKENTSDKNMIRIEALKENGAKMAGALHHDLKVDKELRGMPGKVKRKMPRKFKSSILGDTDL
jgi:hypothetical protein